MQAVLAAPDARPLRPVGESFPPQRRGDSSPRILVVDDERSLRETLAYNLRRAGYEVHMAADGATALQAARSHAPDLILLDVLLPGGMDGFAVCRLLRQEHRCPIILVSALADEIDRVVGLEVGADDYVSKPFGMTELLARIKARLRRVEMDSVVAGAGSEAATGERPVSVGPFQIDPVQREVQVDGRPVHLKRRVFDLLYYLARNAGVTLSRSRLLGAVWPEGVPAGQETRTVDVHIHRLRKRIEQDPARPRYLHTVRGLGYVLKVPRR